MATDRADDLRDVALENEIRLLGRLMDAVADATRPLTPAEVDRALGLPLTTRVDATSPSLREL